jgi:phosphoglycerol transferase MdoB-like AlkP superfamily enzyme
LQRPRKFVFLQLLPINTPPMLLPFRIPKTLLWVFNLLVIFLGLFTAYRVVTLLAFLPQGEQVQDMWPTFFLGLRFDLRWISLMLLPIVLLSLVPRWSPFFSKRNRKLWTWYLALVSFIIIFFFAADFGAFSYNRTRLGASALNFMEDPGISARMLWESYPLVWMLLGLVITVLLLRAAFGKMHLHVTARTDGKRIPYSRKWFLLAIFLFSFFLHGNVGVRPLKWHEATKFNNSFKTSLALNPLQNFFYSLKNRATSFDEPATRAAFPLMQQVLGFESERFDFTRKVSGNPAGTTRPNVVLVVCESFSMYKSSVSGNPLNTTPYFRQLADSGLFYSRCFTPHFSTARGLFATLTGIPDVQLSKFSTRNPQALDQRTIVNDFEGYEKFYFLGGDPSFNNFEGLVKNIEGVQMRTEGKFESRSVNVWGISDKDLFLEANKTFAKQQKPFFAVVQTADNHRPFTIPAGDTSDFRILHPKAEELKKYGFESEDEYNAFRYADYCFQQFMEAARKEAYFDNTIFVFVGVPRSGPISR